MALKLSTEDGQHILEAEAQDHDGVRALNIFVFVDVYWPKYSYRRSMFRTWMLHTARF